uniref:Uncharacterized protein n=1 Tax=Rhizophora mucronata TaxID=61149 RepID=A0A2P2QJM8_RHIMU
MGWVSDSEIGCFTQRPYTQHWFFCCSW